MMIGNGNFVFGRQKSKDVYIFPLAFRYMRHVTVTFDNARIRFRSLLSIEFLNMRIIIGKEEEK